MSLEERWENDLARLRAEGRYRTLTAPAGIDFSSNDYLGYGKLSWPAAEGGRTGAASRLLRGHLPIWDEVETALASWHGAETTLMMTSGYVANEGLLGTLIDSDDVAYSDQCNHASIIDGLRLSRAERMIFPHNDVNALEALLRCRRPGRGKHQAWFIVTESLFGMEGDAAPLAELADVAERYEAHLIVDEAHATGCFGTSGGGMVDAAGLRNRVLATVHTGGKALGVTGAYIAGTRTMKELLVNRCRHLIFTTALPPQIGAWWLDALRRVAADAGARQALRERYELLRGELKSRSIALGGIYYIGTVILGEDDAATSAARRLQAAGFDIRAIRPPTVPAGTARLRISIHADHQPEELRALADALALHMRHSP